MASMKIMFDSNKHNPRQFVYDNRMKAHQNVAL